MRLGVEAAVVEGALVPGDIAIADGSVADVALSRGSGRGIAVPGFVDLQVNGFGGVDFATADTEGYRRAGAALLETGVTAFQPTFVTAPERELVAALQEIPSEPIGPRIVGAHLEGPFLSPARLGAHSASAQRDPDRALLERLLDAGPVAQMTLAPELPGALELINVLHGRGVVVSCGHSNATADEAAAAFDRGVRSVTHLFNAMRPFAHRDPGLAGAALARDDVVVQVILDGHHLADETAKVVWKTAAGRVALVTDAMAATGIGDGRYRLGGIDVEVRDGVARRSEDGVLAGSVATMLDGIRKLHSLGAALPDAIAAATSVPARLTGRIPGVLRAGGDADVVVLDDRLEIRAVFVGGKELVAVG
ncbi:MAG TPA: N-acetylglucosamine-6-phosphate deacetylase [Gaiellaceae bacterium]|nr:N-acetylglucosamine-6-phosphate deacetylase [Gaiellaceae bacterium]